MWTFELSPQERTEKCHGNGHTRFHFNTQYIVPETNSYSLNMATSWKVWLSSFHSIGYSFITKLRSKYMRKHLFILHWATTHCLTLYKKRIYPQGEERHHMWRNSTTRCGLIWCCCHVIAFTRLAIIWYRKLPFWSPTPFHHKLLPPPPPPQLYPRR